jgi:Zn-dependent protease with chaperone function
LRREEAPGLWALTEDVAADVGTRPIEEIRITPGTDLAVYERGTRREKSTDNAKRVLILGAGVLNGFQTTPFRAVLAHEYGHFAHRDTAGGASAMRTGNDMMKFAYAMADAGQAAWWNIAFQFVRLYHFLFIRISHGASRLQEVLADRMAVTQYGAQAFEEGLKHAIRRSVEFPRLAGLEIQNAVKAGRPLYNIYDLTIQAESSPLDADVEKALNQPTSEDDTHPSPADRFRLVRNIKRRNNTERGEMAVWDFFVAKDALTAEMNTVIDRSLERPTPATASS